jgi:GT2 family glycosyltransferase
MSGNNGPAGNASRAACEVAVLVPCYNEQRAVARVIADFKAALPDGVLYVYDNNSTDGTVEAARRAGAVVLAFLSIACGLILVTVTRGRREMKLIAYLALRAPGGRRRSFANA